MSACPTAGTSDVLKETYFPVKSTFSISMLVGRAELRSASVYMCKLHLSCLRALPVQLPRGSSDSGVRDE